MDGKLALAILAIVVRLHLSCSQLTTLYKGPVKPTGPGQEFDRRKWLKAAMPKKEDRCPGKPQKTTEAGTSGKPTTTQSSVTSPIVAVLEAHCTRFTRSGWREPYPEQGKFLSALKQFEFSVTGATYATIYLKDWNLDEKYSIIIDGTQTQIYDFTTLVVNVHGGIVTSAYIKVTLSDNDIMVSDEGTVIAQWHDPAGIVPIWKLSLKAPDIVWNIAIPCI